jgi:NTE family protein
MGMVVFCLQRVQAQEIAFSEGIMTAPAKPRKAPKSKVPAPGPKPLNIALQGGGAHGAYSWGVLDRLLADDRIVIEAISGTSAGAMNGVVLAEGLVEGGKLKARQQLEDFWRAVSDEARTGPIQRTAWDILASTWSLDHNPMLAAFEAFTHAVSPYVFNPMNVNPLRELVLRQIDFKRVQACESVRLFIAATDVHTGRGRIFSNGDIGIDAVMASACLPHMFQAVDIDGVGYWDGGYSGNPALTPFLKSSVGPDVLLVQINPLVRRATPRSAREIVNRMNEITFNTALLKELEHVEFVNRALRQGHMRGLGYREIHLHRIGGGAELAALSASSKLNADWAFLTHLRDLGRAETETWIEAHFADIGARSTIPWHEVTGETVAVPRA